MSKNKTTFGSLRDQLKDAGLVTAKQAKKAERGALRTELRIKKGIDVDAVKQEVEAARTQKIEADRARNEARNHAAQHKALLAQVKQLIAAHSQRQAGEVAYNFTDEKKVKKLYVSEENKTQLNQGYLAIVKVEDRYDLVPEVVARRIQARHADSVLYLHDLALDAIDEDDPYKDYPIPDDLEW